MTRSEARPAGATGAGGPGEHPSEARPAGATGSGGPGEHPAEARPAGATGSGEPDEHPCAPLRRGRADEVILSLASRQHGVVTRAQLLRAGISWQIVKRRLKSRFLRALHRGIYVVGHRLTPQALAQAAAYACGDYAAVSHEIAAHLHGMMRVDDGSEPVHVSLAKGDRRRPGVRIHRVASLPADEVTTVDGIPVTTPARTLLDIASVVSVRKLEKVFTEALGRGLTRLTEVDSILQRHPRHPGAAVLRAILGSGSPARARSVAERHFVVLVRKAGLPEPEVNVTVEGYEVDFLWRRQRLIVEIDGRAYHSTSERFENDRRRDRALVAAGYRVIRITWRQLVDEPIAVAVQVAQALAVFAV